MTTDKRFSRNLGCWFGGELIAMTRNRCLEVEGHRIKGTMETVPCEGLRDAEPAAVAALDVVILSAMAWRNSNSYRFWRVHIPYRPT